jgi:hypothetical protein
MRNPLEDLTTEDTEDTGKRKYSESLQALNLGLGWCSWKRDMEPE